MEEKSKQLIFQKMCAIMQEVGAVEKSQKNTFQNYKFRGIDQFLNALHPSMVKHQVFLCPRVLDQTIETKDRDDGKKGVSKHVHLTVEFDFIAVDGSRVTIGPVLGEGLDTSDKAINKAHTSALKNLLIETFMVPTEDMSEPDKESPQIPPNQNSPVPEYEEEDRGDYSEPVPNFITPAQVTRLWAIASVSGWSNEAVHTTLKKNLQLDSVKHLSPNKYEAFCAYMQKWPLKKPDGDPTAPPSGGKKESAADPISESPPSQLQDKPPQPTSPAGSVTPPDYSKRREEYEAKKARD